MRKIILNFLLLLTLPAVALAGTYSTDENGCYYDGGKILFCQERYFSDLGGDYAKDNREVYYQGQPIDGADPASFTFVGLNYGKDRTGVYLAGQKIPQADPSAFEPIAAGYGRDKDRVYKQFDVLPEADPATFEIINDEYTKDKNAVYYNNEAMEDTHPLTFRLMADGYAKDMNYFYRYGRAVAKSGNEFYNRYQAKDLEGACTAENYAAATATELTALEYGFSRDDLCVYFMADYVENSHAESFVLLSGRLAKDKNYVYKFSEQEVEAIPYAEPNSFEILGGDYYKDKYAVYYGSDPELINGADPSTFHIVCTGGNCTYEAEDTHRYYSNGIEVSLDPATQQLIGEAKLISSSPAGLQPLLDYNSTPRRGEEEQEAVGKYLEPLLYGVYELDKDSQQAILNFIVYGTQTTRALGAGERAGVVNSYKSAFGKLPETDQDWADVMKIANGRWPTERNEIAEERANGRFRYIYQRAPYSWDENDQAAITIIAYGLRTRARNTDSEKAAILTFRKLFMDYPSSASDWDMVRAIAYSGASR